MIFQRCTQNVSSSPRPPAIENKTSPLDVAVNSPDVALPSQPQPGPDFPRQSVESCDSTDQDVFLCPDRLKLYARTAHLYDKTRFELWHRRLDLQLLFAGIFSAIILPLIAETYPFLSEPGPPAYAIRINAFLSISLVISVMTAVFSLHCKQWMDGYDVDLLPRSEASDDIKTLAHACRIHQYRFQALARYHFPSIVGLGAMFIYISIAFFSVALVDFFWHLYSPIGIMLAGLIGMTISLHILTSLQPCISSDSPFKSPLSYLLVNLWLGALDGQLATNGRSERRENMDVEGMKHRLDDAIARWSTSDALKRPMGYP
ncbi:uncharacterized protein EV420DRAFT_1665647 [Desarmillaria tabescens]|uniref:DUF6535 domain-containing protein n=1 Tax=Armillaria tabescens TaxID=1929756 RepID=A0AA39NAG5_ARMTA|nr:uncharacterized protein EV420DRAFT_1665647 [Desarmillaria tabescens]KAK0461963.1 hypothetical protein EV420DRAFT_1665647 [Desarmillaria tabescens]